MYQRITYVPAGAGGWRQKLALVVGMALGLGLVAALIVLSIGLAIVLLPVVAVAAGIGWYRWRKMIGEINRQAEARQAERAAASGGRIIDAEYEVVDDGRRQR